MVLLEQVDDNFQLFLLPSALVLSLSFLVVAVLYEPQKVQGYWQWHDSLGRLR